MYRQLDRSGCSGEKNVVVGLGEPGDVGGLAIKEIRHEDLVCMVLIRGGENIGSLERLREVSEDVEYIKERPRGIGGAGDILEQSVSPTYVTKSNDAQIIRGIRRAYKSSNRQ
jgi:hypothetical protein